MPVRKYVELWKDVERNGDVDKHFPVYYVSQPPHRNDLTPVYYKVISPDGPVFWRRKGDDTGRETSFYDVLLEEKYGFGIQSVQKEHTPWSEDD